MKKIGGVLFEAAEGIDKTIRTLLSSCNVKPTSIYTAVHLGDLNTTR